MASVIETVSSVVLDEVGMVVANDSARSSFTVASGDALLALDRDLRVLGRWPLGLEERGWHASKDHGGWDFTACFVGDGLMVNKLLGHDERLATIALNGEVQSLDEQEQGWLIPAAHSTWLAATQTTIRRCRLTQQQDLW